MDRISGLMPQIGWSPLLMPATPKKAPASTVEPAAKSANINGGMGAEVDTQTGQDRAQQVQALEAQARVFAQSTGQEVTAAGAKPVADATLKQAPSEQAGPKQAPSEPAGPKQASAERVMPSDPDTPAGPPPTFEWSVLEAEAARRAAERLEPAPQSAATATEPQATAKAGAQVTALTQDPGAAQAAAERRDAGTPETRPEKARAEVAQAEVAQADLARAEPTAAPDTRAQPQATPPAAHGQGDGWQTLTRSSAPVLDVTR